MATKPPLCASLSLPRSHPLRRHTHPSQVDLWATAVLYAMLWGTKTFVVAPPTAANLELMRRWQMNGEAADDETFPADLEGARVVAVGRGQALFLPSGWIHAVHTAEDSAVLGWNWQPAAQLPASLHIVRTPWGAKGAEVRQLRAFQMRDYVSHLWVHLKSLVPGGGGATARGADPTAAAAAAAAAEARDATDDERRVLRALCCFLSRRLKFAERRKLGVEPTKLLAAALRRAAPRENYSALSPLTAAAAALARAEQSGTETLLHHNLATDVAMAAAAAAAAAAASAAAASDALTLLACAAASSPKVPYAAAPYAAAGAAGAGDGSDLMAHESVAPFDLMGAGANGPRSARHVALFDGAAV